MTSDEGSADLSTTHETGGGRPRLIFSTGASAQLPPQDLEQGAFELLDPVTRIGSGPDAHLRLPGIPDDHAEIVHDEFDEYVFLQRSELETSTVNGEQMGRRPLRTGDRVEFGPWVLSYFREEYADHGRPHGGRQGGEGALEPDQPAREEASDSREPTGEDLRTVVTGPGAHRGRELDPPEHPPL